MPCLCVSPLSGFSSPNLRRPHLSSPPAYRIYCLLTFVHLQSARFPRRCPEAGKNSTALGLSLKPITTNAVCSLGHRRRPNPQTTVVSVVACVGRLVSPGTATLGRVAAEVAEGIHLQVEGETLTIERDRVRNRSDLYPRYLDHGSSICLSFLGQPVNIISAIAVRTINTWTSTRITSNILWLS